jgi:hypothetical protein
MILAVQLKGPTPESNRSLRFSESPVRIGRNQLNDIPLDDPFVSEWHGIIRFTAQDVAYFDLGSTNGSILDGQKLPKNVPAALTDASRLQLGRIELSVSPTIEEAGSSKTIGWGQTFRTGPAIPPGARPGMASRSDVVTPPAPGAGTSGVDYRANIVTPPPPGGGAAAPARAPGPGGPDAAVLARYKKLLETFGEAFVGLRKGYEQFGAEVGVRTISGRTPLHRARTSRELLDYLVQPGVDLNAATKDLIAIFADFGIHHIAMMEAVTEGVRSLLHSLAPPEKKSQWKEYLERFDHAVNDDQALHAGIFGAEFARAYASVVVGDGVKSGNDRG